MKEAAQGATFPKREPAATWFPQKQRQGSPSSFCPTPGRWPPSEPRGKTWLPNQRAEAHLLISAVCYEDHYPTHPNLEDKLRRVLFGKSGFFAVVQNEKQFFILLDFRMNQVHIFLLSKRSPIYHFVKGLDCLWEMLVWSHSIPPTEGCRNQRERKEGSYRSLGLQVVNYNGNYYMQASF